MIFPQVLITGGAGFIGSHLAAYLVDREYRVRVIDNLDPQVHGFTKVPKSLPPSVEFIKGDVTDRQALKEAVHGVDAIFHFAALVGIGQSQYDMARYVNTNVFGTANLLDILANERHSVKKLLVATSMAMYGEGLYRRPSDKKAIIPPRRSEVQMSAGRFEPYDHKTDEILEAVPTPETAPLECNNIYALNKKHQEEYCLHFGKVYQIPTVACRFFSVYGRGQSLNNPYTGVASIFTSQIRNGIAPSVYEDGLQSRDFVHIKDVTSACLLLLENDESNSGQIFNIGSGHPTTILQLAEKLIEISGKSLRPDILGQYRIGDIRHCYADTRKIERLGFRTEIGLDEGLNDLFEWSKKEDTRDLSARANQELLEHNLLRSRKEGSL